MSPDFLELPTLPPAPELSWYERELDGLIEVLGWSFALRVLIGFVLFLLLYRAAAWVPRLLWRVGLDRQRRAASLASMIGLSILAIGFVWELRPLFEVAPTITLVLLAGTLFASAVAFPTFVQSFFAGARLATRGRLIEGQQIEVDGVRGTVRRIGLLETTLRMTDGATVHVPNHHFAKSKLKVLRAQHAALVEVEVRVDGELSDVQLERLRAAVYLSPYRRVGTRPAVDESARDRGRIKVDLQTWATRDADMVRRALRRVVLESLEVKDEAG